MTASRRPTPSRRSTPSDARSAPRRRRTRVRDRLRWRRRGGGGRWLPALAVGLLALLLAGGIALEWGGDAPPAAVEAVLDEIAPFQAELVSDRYRPLANALRAGDLEAGRRALADLERSDRERLGPEETLLGLAAWAAHDPATARDLLESAPGDGPLADWRHLALAELGAEDDPDAALEHLAALVQNHHRSALWPQALVTAAHLYREQGEDRRALELVDLARREGVPGPQRVEMEVLAWEIGGGGDGRAVRREAARRLLMVAPWRASAMGAADLFVGADGKVDWRGVLTGDELERRAATFLRLGQPDAARITLDDVPPRDRDHGWHLLAAEAFTSLHRSREALAVLDVAPTATSEERAAVEYHRGLAALDLSDRRGGGGELSPDRRRWMRTAARGHLARASELAADPDLAADALRHLYRVLDPRDDAARRDVLAAIRLHDPDDRTGARPLWEDGWNAYQDGELERAVALWRELAEIYPGTREAHRGLYWQARALERMDRSQAARRVYDRLLQTSDTSDFYRRQAMARTGSTPWLVGTAAEELSELKPWEIDPLLERAKRLSDAGLDPLARRELELLREELGQRGRADATALHALILSRSGRGREAMTLLRRAYPALGGPYQGAIPTEILRAYYPLVYAEEIREGARRTGLPPYLLAGMIRQESAFDPRATSRVGARGLMQLMPPTAKEVAASLGESYDTERLYDPEFSILLGSTYFRRVLEMFDGNVELALAGYNGGPNRIRRLWREREPGADVDEFFETLAIDESRIYVKRILVLADSYRRLYPDEEAVEPTPTAG